MRSWRHGDRRRADHHRPRRRPRRRAHRAADGARRAPAASRSSPRPATSRRPCAPCSAHKPDVLVLDLNMPGELEPRSTRSRASREASPDTRVVVLTMQEDPAFAREALRAGAARLRAQGGRRRRARRGRAARRRGRHVPQPASSARALAAAPPRAVRAARRPHRARGRGPAADRARPHERRDRRSSSSSRVRTVESHRAHIQQKLRPLHRAPSWCATRSTTGFVEAGVGRLRPAAAAPGPTRPGRRRRARTLSSPPASSTRSRMPARPKPVAAARSGSKPTPSSATATSHRAVRRAHVDLDARRRARA